MRNLLARADNLHYTGLDASRDMVLRARERYLGETRAAFVHGELTEAPLAPAGMDRIVAVNVVYFWQPLAPALQALYILLRPGGTLVLGLRNHNSMAGIAVFRHGFTTYHGPELQHALTQAGFANIRLDTFAEDSVDVLGDTMQAIGDHHRPQTAGANMNVLVNLVGLILMALVVWWFWLSHRNRAAQPPPAKPLSLSKTGSTPQPPFVPRQGNH